MTVFRDCLGREIKVDDVVAIGFRDGNYGAIVIGAVTGFTEKDIQISKLERGKWYEYRDGSGKGWMPSQNGDAYRIIKSRCMHGSRCFITGMSLDELCQTTGVSEEAL